MTRLFQLLLLICTCVFLAAGPVAALEDPPPTPTSQVAPASAPVVAPKSTAQSAIISGVVASEPQTLGDVVRTVVDIRAKAKVGEYREVVALCVFLLMFLWRRFASQFVLAHVSSWWAGFFAVLLAFLGTLPEALRASPFSWYDFVWSALLASAEAIALWQLVFKKLSEKVPWLAVPAGTPKPSAAGG
jgi:hypothetical protein